MTGDQTILPEGRLGQTLAIGMALAALLAVRFAIVAPAVDWYQLRQNQLSQQRQEIAHINAQLPLIPMYRHEIILLKTESNNRQVLLRGDTDIIAGANLLSEIMSLTNQADVNVVSTALLPAQPLGSLRCIAIEVNLTATWPELMNFLGLIDTGRPRMLLNNLTIENSGSSGNTSQAIVLQVSFSIAAFRA